MDRRPGRGHHSGLSVAEDLGLESLDRSAGRLPGIPRQAGLVAGMLEKRRAVPAVLGCDLGQQQAAPVAVADDQAVTADFDVARVAEQDGAATPVPLSANWPKSRPKSLAPAKF